MHTSELHYDLPPELIAQHPADRRDASRLLVLERTLGRVRHEPFPRLPELLPPGCLLVLNDTRVLPARLRLRRRTGARITGLFIRERDSGGWEVMLTSSKRLRSGEELDFVGSPRRLRLRQPAEPGVWQADPIPPGIAADILNECGEAPLPPYIHRGAAWSAGIDGARSPSEGLDRERYQTIYAREPGAIAAPTAGLHFTEDVFAGLNAAGIQHVFVTLHVGVGTFAPIRTERLEAHPMHAEWYACPPGTAAAVSAARREGRPVVAVGTTSVRVLESCADESGHVEAGSGWTRLFIYPPYRFRTVGGLLTNFHLPGSTLLALIFAFAGREATLAAYQAAIAQRYRFYSYGDAMLIS